MNVTLSLPTVIKNVSIRQEDSSVIVQEDTFSSHQLYAVLTVGITLESLSI